jgi:hypothetical protein
MGQEQVVTALRDKRAALGGTIVELERRIARHRAELGHLDAVLRMIAPGVEPDRIWPKVSRQRSAWFLRHGEGTRKVFDVLRTSAQALTAREIAAQLIKDGQLDGSDPRLCDLVQRSVQGILKRAGTKVEGEKTASGLLAWRINQAA